MNALERASDAAARTAANASPWVETLARIGYYCKGIVYTIVGIIAFRAAFDMTGSSPDSGSALRAILTQPFGQVLLGLVGVGLFGYVLWKFVQAANDPENRGTDAKGIIYRTAYVISGVIYGSLAVQALRLAFGSGSGDESASQTASGLMANQWGVWLVGLAGLGVAGYGVHQLIKAWTADFSRQFRLSQVSAGWRKWVIRLSRAGMAARGVVFLIIGWFFLKAAWQHDPSEAKGLSGALQMIEQTAYGPWLAGLIALGLVAYGVFTFLKGRYRRIDA